MFGCATIYLICLSRRFVSLFTSMNKSVIWTLCIYIVHYTCCQDSGDQSFYTPTHSEIESSFPPVTLHTQAKPGHQSPIFVFPTVLGHLGYVSLFRHVSFYGGYLITKDSYFYLEVITKVSVSSCFWGLGFMNNKGYCKKFAKIL